jgi:hypothetical protein
LYMQEAGQREISGPCSVHPVFAQSGFQKLSTVF